jgi:hypothetical protein
MHVNGPEFTWISKHCRRPHPAWPCVPEAWGMKHEGSMPPVPSTSGLVFGQTSNLNTANSFQLRISSEPTKP